MYDNYDMCDNTINSGMWNITWSFIHYDNYKKNKLLQVSE